MEIKKTQDSLNNLKIKQIRKLNLPLILIYKYCRQWWALTNALAYGLSIENKAKKKEKHKMGMV